MKCKLIESGRIVDLSIETAEGIDWTMDLLGNYDALSDDRFRYDEDEDVYHVEYLEYEWWRVVIAKLEWADRVIEDLKSAVEGDEYDRIAAILDSPDAFANDLEDQAGARVGALEEVFGEEFPEIFRPTPQERIDMASSLTSLKRELNSMTAEELEQIDPCDLPSYSAFDIEDTEGIWSWDDDWVLLSGGDWDEEYILGVRDDAGTVRARMAECEQKYGAASPGYIKHVLLGRAYPVGTDADADADRWHCKAVRIMEEGKHTTMEVAILAWEFEDRDKSESCSEYDFDNATFEGIPDRDRHWDLNNREDVRDAFEYLGNW